MATLVAAVLLGALPTPDALAQAQPDASASRPQARESLEERRFRGFGARRSETLSGLGGPGRDERWERIDNHATALAGVALVCAIIGAWLVDAARGGDGEPFTRLGAFDGLAYVLAVAFLRWRS